MKIVKEKLNEANEELFYMVNTDPEIKEYSLVDKNNETVWAGSMDDAITFLLRNAGVSSSYEAKNILAKADKFGGQSIIHPDDVIKSRGHETTIPGAKVHGAPVMMQPFMVNKEIAKGRFEPTRKTSKQIRHRKDRIDCECEDCCDTREKEAEKKVYTKNRDKLKDFEYYRKKKEQPGETIPMEEPEEEIIIEPKQTHGKSKERREEIERGVKKRRPRVNESIDKYLNELEGGKGEHLDPVDVDQDQLEIGVETEMEHTNDSEISKEIALDHLAEIPDYYTKLVAAGLVDEPEAIKLHKELFVDEK
jgi:hypothetical protein